MMQYQGRHFVPYIHQTYGGSGSIWEGRYKASLVQDDRYLLTCMRYIELNPVRAGLVKDPGDYRWSSYRCHAFGKAVRLWSPHSLYKALGTMPARRQASYRGLVGDALTIEAIAKVRHCANTGLVLGTEAFIKQVETRRM